MKIRILVAVTVLIIGVSQTQAQHYGHLGSKSPSPCVSVWQEPIGLLLEAEKGINHPLQRTNPEAQAFFNQGLTFFYGFDGEAAMRSFHQAAKADDKLAIAHWGIALAAGGDLNLPIDDPCMQLAIEEIRKADGMLAPDADKLYINALITRYDAKKPNSAPRDPRQLEVAYMQVMKQVAEKLGGPILILQPFMPAAC